MDMLIKFSILMPTYNDEKYILSAVHSVIEQTYQDWELIIIDDGSDDTTARVIAGMNNKKLRYIYQENGDQLNALLNGARFISGDYVMLLHSDDMLYNANTLSEISQQISIHPHVDGFYADYIKIDNNGDPAGVLKVLNSMKHVTSSAILCRGDNRIGDHFITKTEVFLSNVKNHYLTDSTIYYLNYIDSGHLNLLKIKPWYKYRVFDENYIHSDVGKYVTFSGQIRTVSKLLKRGIKLNNYIVINNFIFKLFRKYFPEIVSVVKTEAIDWKFVARYFYLWKKDFFDKADLPGILQDQILKIMESIRVNSLGRFDKPLEIKALPQNIYRGKDARKFFMDWKNRSIDPFYHALLYEDYDHIVVNNEVMLDHVNEAQNFLSLYYPVIKV